MTAFVLLVMTLVAGASAQVCTETTSDLPADKMPAFNVKQFTADIEMYSQETGRVVQMMMYYNQFMNLIRVNTMDKGKVMSDLFFFYSGINNYVLAYDYDQRKTNVRGTCTYQLMDESAELYIVGGIADRMPQSLEVFHFQGKSGFSDNNVKVTYEGKDTIRNLPVTKYSSCQKWSYRGQSATVKVTHYFSDPTTFKYAVNTVHPVMIKVEGIATLKNTTNVPIMHVYSFFNYSETVQDADSETIQGIACDGPTPEFPFPAIATHMGFSMEVVNSDERSTRYYRMVIDSDYHFSIVTGQPSVQQKTRVGADMNGRTYFRDYEIGLTFNIDNEKQTCTVLNITDPNNNFLFDVDVRNPDGTVHQMTPRDIFFHGVNKYNDMGMRKVRGIPCNTYVAKNVKSYFDTSRNETLEWYFAQETVHTPNDNAPVKYQYRIPVMMQRWYSDDAFAKSVAMSFYHVDYGIMQYDAGSVRSCFPDKAINNFRLLLSGAKSAVANTYLNFFKWATAYTLAQTAKVRIWRISGLQMYYTANDVIVEFELLDRPPYAGDVPKPYIHTSLEDATANLRNAVQNGMNLYGYDSTTHNLTLKIPVANDLQIVTSNDQAASANYSGGALAGLGIAMLIIGAAGGIGAAYKFL